MTETESVRRVSHVGGTLDWWVELATRAHSKHNGLRGSVVGLCLFHHVHTPERPGVGPRPSFQVSTSDSYNKVLKGLESFENFCLLQGQLGPSGLKSQKGVQNEFLPAPGAESPKRKKSQKMLKNARFGSFPTPFLTFWAPGTGGLETHFGNDLCHFWPEGPK